MVLETAQNLGAKNIRVWAKRIASKDFSEVEYQRLVTDTQKYADLAAEYDINICFENHRKTYTDTTTSAKKLLYDVSRDNVFMYWQPQAGESINERLDAIRTLKNKLKTTHVFNWDDEFNRYPLKDAKEEWKIYANELGCDRPYLLEFVINDDINQFREDVKTLKEIIGG